MSALLFALVGSFLAATGARDQLLVAQLRSRLGASSGLLAVALGGAAATAALAAWAGSRLAGGMSEDAATMFVALALLLAAAELAWPNTVKPPAEPTRSLGAIALVLFTRQLTDASRFLVVAVAVALASPQMAALGGAIGGGAAVGLGWAAGAELERRVPVRLIRRILAGALLALGVFTGLAARGVIL